MEKQTEPKTKNVHLELLECQNILLLLNHTLDDVGNCVYENHDETHSEFDHHEAGGQLLAMAHIMDDVRQRLHRITTCDCTDPIEFPIE